MQLRENPGHSTILSRPTICLKILLEGCRTTSSINCESIQTSSSIIQIQKQPGKVLPSIAATGKNGEILTRVDLLFGQRQSLIQISLHLLSQNPKKTMSPVTSTLQWPKARRKKGPQQLGCQGSKTSPPSPMQCRSFLKGMLQNECIFWSVGFFDLLKKTEKRRLNEFKIIQNSFTNVSHVTCFLYIVPFLTTNFSNIPLLSCVSKCLFKLISTPLITRALRKKLTKPTRQGHPNLD